MEPERKKKNLFAEINKNLVVFSSVQLFSHVRLFATPWTTAHQASLSITNSWGLLNSCPLGWWWHPTISSSEVPFYSHLQFFPASGHFQMRHFFIAGGQSIGVSASESILPMNSLDWCPLGWTGWISFQSKGLSRVFSTPQFKSINSSAFSFLYSPALISIHDYWKNHTFDTFG